MKLLETGGEILGKGGTDLRLVDQALDRLAQATPRVKRQLLLACARAVNADDTVAIEEAELLRAFAEALDCPMPPMVA